MSAAKIARPVRPEEHFATKADIANLERRLELKIADSEKRLELKIAALRTDMTHLEKRLERKIANSEKRLERKITALRTDIANLERRLEVGIERMRGESHSNMNRMILWFVGVLLTSQSILLAAIKWL